MDRNSEEDLPKTPAAETPSPAPVPLEVEKECRQIITACARKTDRCWGGCAIFCLLAVVAVASAVCLCHFSPWYMTALASLGAISVTGLALVITTGIMTDRARARAAEEFDRHFPRGSPHRDTAVAAVEQLRKTSEGTVKSCAGELYQDLKGQSLGVSATPEKQLAAALEELGHEIPPAAGISAPADGKAAALPPPATDSSPPLPFIPLEPCAPEEHPAGSGKTALPGGAGRMYCACEAQLDISSCVPGARVSCPACGKRLTIPREFP